MAEDKSSDSMPLPLATKYEDWRFMVRALLQLNAHEHTVSNNEVMELTKMPLTKVSGNLGYLRLLGIITSESKGSQISLSQDGTDFARSLVMKDAKTEKALITKLVRIGLKDVNKFIELHRQSNDFTFDMLFDHIKYLAKVKDASDGSGNIHGAYKISINTVIEMLVIAEILDESFLASKNRSENLRPAGVTIQKKTFDIPTNCQRDWIEKLFKGLKDVNPPQINKTFIGTSVVGNNHEASVMKIARFLDISDDEDNRGANYEKLRYYGTDDFRNNLFDIVKEKYSKILAYANLANVKRDNLVAGFMKEYDMDGKHAEKAMEILIDLCEFAGIELSEDLAGKSRSAKQEPRPSVIIKNNQEPRNSKSMSSSSVTTPRSSSVAPEPPVQVRLNVNTDGKEWQPFDNTLKFLKQLKQLDNISVEVIMTDKVANPDQS